MILNNVTTQHFNKYFILHFQNNCKFKNYNFYKRTAEFKSIDAVSCSKTPP